MRVFGIAGYSGNGKTVLVTALIPVLRARGLKVATIKHAHHAFDLDQPGKDSFRHRAAGAEEVMIASAKRWALMHELRDGEEEPELPELLLHLGSVDLALIEGFKMDKHPKLEVHRPSHGTPLLAQSSDSVVAVASDGKPEGFSGTVIDLNDIEAIADLVVKEAKSPEEIWPRKGGS